MTQLALREQKDTDCCTSLLALTLTSILKAFLPWVHSIVSFRTVMCCHLARFFHLHFTDDVVPSCVND